MEPVPEVRCHNLLISVKLANFGSSGINIFPAGDGNGREAEKGSRTNPDGQNGHAG